jgi:hypothetical protein
LNPLARELGEEFLTRPTARRTAGSPDLWFTGKVKKERKIYPFFAFEVSFSGNMLNLL